MTEAPDVLYHRTGSTVTVTINRPEHQNAIRIETYEQLASALQAAAADDAVRAVVITGAGAEAFSTGGDAEMAHAVLTTKEAARQHMQRVLRVSDPMVRMDKPVIAAVNGLASGSGVEILMFCDFVIASTNASFGFSGTDIGLCLGWGTPQMLPAQVGLRRAEEILLLSRRVSAEEAGRIGLVTSVVASSELESAVGAVCERFEAMPVTGVRTTKAALRSVKQTVLGTMESTLELCADAIAGPDARSAFDAMLSGRLRHEKVAGLKAPGQ